MPLDAHSKAVLEWFDENVTGFAKDFGLMDGMIRDTGLVGEDRAVFVRKLDAIYGHAMRVTATAPTKE